MARNHSSKSKPSRREEKIDRKGEEIAEESSSLLLRPSPPPTRSASSWDESPVEEGGVLRSVVRETLTLPSAPPVAGNERDSAGRRFFSNPLTKAVASPENSAGGGWEATLVPVSVLSDDSKCRSFPSGFQGQFGMSHQEALASVTAQAQVKLPAAHPSSSSGLPLNSLIPSASSAFVPIPRPQRPQPLLDNNFSTPETVQNHALDQKAQSTRVVAKAPSVDCYNWRKYGQKQVKGIQCCRSYYRCTHANCIVRKSVMRCYSGSVMEVVYKGQHNHDPPQKIRYTKESRVLSSEPLGGGDTASHPGEEINGSKSPTATTELSSDLAMSKQQLGYSSGSDGGDGIKVKEYDDEPEPKRRITYSAPPLKTARGAEVVVHRGSDLGPLNDGYKWRKYGQKIVKGNPNPRSYYKCTNDGCPVRKHVERASDDAKALVITYEGKHNHERVASENSYGPYGPALLIAAAAAITAGGQLTASNDVPVQEPPKQFLSDRKDEEERERALELGGEMALESAQTLLSIRLSFKSFEAGRGERNSNAVERPFFNGNNAVVSV